jgi:hypothetical protein
LDFEVSYQIVQLTLNDEFADQTKAQNGKDQVYDTVIIHCTAGFTLKFCNVTGKFEDPIEKEGKTNQVQQQFQTGVDIIITGILFEFGSGKIHPEDVIDAACDKRENDYCYDITFFHKKILLDFSELLPIYHNVNDFQEKK